MPRLAPALLAAPLLLLAYGGARLLDPRHSPGMVWTLSHVCYLLAFPALGCAAIALRGLVADRSATVRAAGTALVVVGWVGALAGVGQAVVDLLSGWGAADRAARNAAAAHLRDVIPGSDLFYGVWPSLAQVAVVGLLALAAVGVSRRVPAWTPVLALVAFLLPAVTSLDLIPVAALAVIPALLPAYHVLRAVPDATGVTPYVRDAT